MNVCNVILLGRVGQRVELRTTPSGMNVSSVRVAVEVSGAKGEKRTDWFNVTCWGKLAELTSQYLGVGDVVYMEAQLRNRKSADGKDAGLELHAREFRKVGGPSRAHEPAKAQASPQPPAQPEATVAAEQSVKGSRAFDAPAPEFTEDDIPF